MATFTCYLEENAEFPNKDLKLLGTKFKGKVFKVELEKNEVNGNVVKSQSVAQTKVFRQVFDHLGLSKDGLKMLKDDMGYDGKLTKADDYDFFLNVRGVRHKATLELARYMRTSPTPRASRGSGTATRCTSSP